MVQHGKNFFILQLHVHAIIVFIEAMNILYQALTSLKDHKFGRSVCLLYLNGNSLCCFAGERGPVRLKEDFLRCTAPAEAGLFSSHIAT